MRWLWLFGLVLALVGDTTSTLADLSSPNNQSSSTNQNSVSTPPETVSKPQEPCPHGYVHVAGEYCASVHYDCLEWMDPPDAAARRCKQYGASTCVGKTVHKDFCIERTEHLEPNGSRLPQVNVDAYQAEAICKKDGARLCYESEHQMSCQGWDLRPYPQGWTRQCGDGQCNCDISTDLGPVEHRTDHRKTPEETAGCVSQWGVLNLVGDVDEWWMKDQSASKYAYVLRSGHWMPVRDRCDGATIAHGPLYSNNSAGFRCCVDPKFQ